MFIRGNENPVSYELQMLFDYGISQEILGTLLGKILPVYFPQLLFEEDGCEVIPLGGDSKAVISGDRTGVDKQECYKVAFEFKCLFPGKKYATGVHYSLPIYYTTQVLSQMAAKGCSEVACISFTPELIERMSTGLQMFKQSGSCKCYIETLWKRKTAS